jgi:p-aminobenzoyl-glutamate transporter AbgT
MYEKICIPLLQINSNIYAFLSGILVSLSTNIFAALCFEPVNFCYQWHYYFSTLLLMVSGAICMYISVKVVNFQNYISQKQITDQKSKKEIVRDATALHKAAWIICYSLFFVFLITGFITLGLSWVFGRG